LDIPQDALSSRLLSFLRYFSLPLEGEQIAKLRREVLASRPAGIAAGEQKTRAAVALGAVAAADKGIFLSPEALAEYAAAIDPEEGQSGDGEFNGKQGNSPEQQYPGREGEKRRNPSAAGGEGDDTPAAGDLRKKFESLPANQPLVDFLNRLPGKSGGRWIVFPFTFFSGDVAFRVSLRILLSSEGSGRDGPLLVLDIRGKRARWFFCLSGYGTAHSRADISLYPPLPRRALKIAEGELRKILGDFAEKIHMKNREAPFLAEEENQTPLPFVNEKV
jgi:hypothetical protein